VEAADKIAACGWTIDAADDWGPRPAEWGYSTEHEGLDIQTLFGAVFNAPVSGTVRFGGGKSHPCENFVDIEVSKDGPG